MKLKNKISLAVALCFLAAGAAISALNIPISSGILSGIFAVGLSMLLTTIYKHFKYGEGVEQDERTKKIAARAITASWVATLVLTIVLMFADRFGAKLGVRETVSIVVFFMIFSFSALNWYFERKGDSE